LWSFGLAAFDRQRRSADTFMVSFQAKADAVSERAL
jgi:hypothetical protein